MRHGSAHRSEASDGPNRYQAAGLVHQRHFGGEEVGGRGSGLWIASRHPIKSAKIVVFAISDPSSARRGVTAARRLAPVQLALWGHPVSSRLSAIDGFLSVDSMEREGGEEDYDESVYRLSGIGACVAPPDRDPVTPLGMMRDYGNVSGGLPFTVFIDAEGTIVHRHAGALTRDDAAALIDRFLAGS